MTRLYEIRSAFKHLMRALERPSPETPPDVATDSAPVAPPAPTGIHPGLTDQQLVVLLAAAAYEALGRPVRIEKFRPLTARDMSWSASGRHDLQSHKLK